MPTREEEEFEKLERLNSLLDVWIDEEEYKNIKAACLPDEAKNVLEDVFEDAPDAEQKDKKDWWLNLPPESPIKTVKIPPAGYNYPNEAKVKVWPDCDINEKNKGWAYLFWAKLIRAEIQRKGTDSFFDRFDELLAYLERRLPISQDYNSRSGNKEPSLEKIKISVLYLLEMAAIGFGPDTRSFAERARRLLKLKKLDHKNNKSFRDFYDLLAGYNIGVSYFHEAEYRKAVLEFNWIIKKFDDAKNNKGDKKEKISLKYAKNRFGRELLYLPAVMYRAQVHLKLQLAYHAYVTITDKKRIIETFSNYKKATVEIIKAEALLLMRRTNEALCALKKVLKALNLTKDDNLTWSDICDIIINTEDKLGKLKGRLLGLMFMWQLRDQNSKKSSDLFGSMAH